MKVLCTKRRGYEWTNSEKGCFRGYVQVSGGIVLRGREAVEYFAQATDFESFQRLLQTIDGCFSVIVTKGKKTWAAVDIARSMPLYYSSDCAVISDSSEAIRAEKAISKENTDKLRMLEMYATSYVVHENTLYKDIKQIELGCAAEFTDENCKIAPYFVHKAEIQNISREEAKAKLARLTDEMLDRILKVVGGRRIVISLSGGYDSRYLACSLKQHGIDDVICYTYGKDASFEIRQSKKVAEALGYEWHCVEYTDDKIKNILSEGNKAYFDYCNGHDYTLYLQNYIAVRELKEQGVLPDSAVFLTGLCNDMPTGSYFPAESELTSEHFNNRCVAEWLYNMRFVRFKLSEKMREIYISETIKKLDFWGLAVKDYQSFVSAEDCMDTGYSHSRCFLNMNKSHEFFGYEWLLPCWDRNLLKFWYSLPAEYRYKQNLYEEYITEVLAAKYGVGTKKQLALHGKTTFIVNLKRFIGGWLVRIAYPLGIPIRRSADINNFAPLEVVYYKNIKQKNAIKSERAALTLLQTIYLMEQRYGKKWYGYIKRELR